MPGSAPERFPVPAGRLRRSGVCHPGWPMIGPSQRSFRMRSSSAPQRGDMPLEFVALLPLTLALPPDVRGSPRFGIAVVVCSGHGARLPRGQGRRQVGSGHPRKAKAEPLNAATRPVADSWLWTSLCASEARRATNIPISRRCDWRAAWALAMRRRAVGLMLDHDGG